MTDQQYNRIYKDRSKNIFKKRLKIMMYLSMVFAIVALGAVAREEGGWIQGVVAITAPFILMYLFASIGWCMRDDHIKSARRSTPKDSL